MAGWKRTLAGWLMRSTGHPARVRRRLYGDRRGLRILTFHRVPAEEIGRFREIVDWCAGRFEIVGPEEVDRLQAGTFEPGERDKMLFTFDDGHAEDHASAEWLAGKGHRAIFFIIPSYVDRSVAEFMRYHVDRGVEPFDIAQERSHESALGLTRQQVAEMASMGHRIGAHNFAHRDLGRLHDEAAMQYEVGQALESVAELTGQPCEDFAWAFGNVAHLSAEAAAFLRRRCRRSYSSVRGLNLAAGDGALLLRDAIHPADPQVLSKLFAEGGADSRWSAEREALSRL